MHELQSRLDVPVGPEFDDFEVFVVGGAVRDALRGFDPEDIDLMVVPVPGEIDDPVDVLAERMTMIDPESTIPVFMDSHGREVALPRTEENAGAGHRGFDMHVVPAGTPVDEAVRIDLERRDLTVNAMAFNVRTGNLFDPFDGRGDLEAGVVRHVSDAFREDPLRVVRLARFAPRLNAEIPDETLALARDIAGQRDENGNFVLGELPVERVTKEFRKVVRQADDVGRFFRVLAEIEAPEEALDEPDAPDELTALDLTFPVVANDDVDAIAEVVSEARLAAPEGRRVDAALAAIGQVIDDAEAFAESQDITRQERATVHAGRRFGDRVRRFDSVPADDAIEAFARVAGERGASVQAHLAAAEGVARAHDLPFDRDAVAARFERARDAFESIDGASLIEEDVHPENIGGEAFRELLDERRADRLAAAD